MNNKKKYKVLVFPGGTEIGLEINSALKYCKDVELYSVSSNAVNHAPYVYESHFTISDIYNPSCIDELNSIIEMNGITHLFPANPFIIDFLNKNRGKVTCTLCLSDKNVIEICRSKRKTYEMFEGIIPCPVVFSNADEVNLPAFLKPDSGYGAQGALAIEKEESLSQVVFDDSVIVSEFLPGEEYSVDCFSDHNGQLLYSMARSRERIRMGTSMHSECASESIQEIADKYAKTILSKLKIVGAWFFQIKKSQDGLYKLLEIEPRIGGTTVFSRVRGVNMPYLTLRAYDCDEVATLKLDSDVIIDRCLKNRYQTNIYYNTLYIDLDDTIIIKNKVNINAISLIYQCINKGKQVILLTKSLEKDLSLYLRRFKIEHLFDEIIWIKEDDLKSKYIIRSDSIFIDDSFSQRAEVQEICKIKTFDPSMIEVLLDDKSN